MRTETKEEMEQELLDRLLELGNDLSDSQKEIVELRRLVRRVRDFDPASKRN